MRDTDETFSYTFTKTGTYPYFLTALKDDREDSSAVKNAVKIARLSSSCDPTQLPVEFREIIILREYEELSYQEIATLLALGEGEWVRDPEVLERIMINALDSIPIAMTSPNERLLKIPPTRRRQTHTGQYGQN